MLRMANFPPDRLAMRAWFARHVEEWRSGTAHRFAIEHNGHFIGLVDIDEISGSEGELGYWLARNCWGQGYAFEAAEALVQFAFADIGLSRLWSGHAEDNVISGRILRKLGFVKQDVIRKISLSRGDEIFHQRYKLEGALLTPPI